MYRKSVKIALILVYLVIVAGAMVRMTGSGMGCPDWPKCFGYYIPPTEIEELEWQPKRSFEKGQVIIYNESLQVASKDFITSEEFDSTNWELYTKHDYAIFNVWHTWIEYINRLFGALAGIAILIMAVLSFRKWKFKKRITVLSVLSVFLIGFQAWLGATVVYSVLSPVKITIHMLMALVIVAVLLYLLQVSKEKIKIFNVSQPFKIILLAALTLTLVQVALGTQVRQFVDDQIDVFGYDAKSSWLSDAPLVFYVHRTFSILIFLLNFSIWFINRKNGYNLKYVNLLMVLLILEIGTGIAMYYLDFPALSQPLHLVIATLFFGVQFYVVLEAFRKPRTVKSL